jgi:hypothetical protein
VIEHTAPSEYDEASPDDGHEFADFGPFIAACREELARTPPPHALPPQPTRPAPASPVALPEDLAFDPVADWRRKPGWTVERQQCFIMALAETGSVTKAAETAGVTARSAYRLRMRPGAESFRVAWSQAQKVAVDTLTAIAFDRAIIGVRRGVYSAGKRVGEEWVPSDRLLMFLLTHLDSQRYGKLSGVLPFHIPDQVAKAQDLLPAANRAIVDQPAHPEADLFEQFETFQPFPAFD